MEIKKGDIFEVFHTRAEDDEEELQYIRIFGEDLGHSAVDEKPFIFQRYYDENEIPFKYFVVKDIYYKVFESVREDNKWVDKNIVLVHTWGISSEPCFCGFRGVFSYYEKTNEICWMEISCSSEDAEEYGKDRYFYLMLKIEPIGEKYV